MNANQSDKSESHGPATLGAGEFWLKAIWNPTLRRFGVSGHAALFLAFALTAKLVGPVFDMSPNTFEVLAWLLGGLSAFMGAGSLVVSATLAQAMVGSQKLQPPGFDNDLTIAEATGSALVNTAVALVILVGLR